MEMIDTGSKSYYNEVKIGGHDMIKVGIAGVRGLSAVRGFSCIEDVSVEAFCDINEQLLIAKAKEHNISKTYRVFDDMLAADIDAVVIATPMQCHVEQALKAMNAGKHVLSEVTAGVTMDELFWLCDVCEKTGAVYMLAENYCYTSQVMQIKAMVEAGLFGELYFGEGEYLHDIKNLARYPDGTTSWRSYWQLGTRGCFYPTHSLGPVMTWFKAAYPDERILELSCYGTGSHVDKNLRQDDTTLTLIRLSNDRLVKIRVDCISPRPHNMFGYSLQGAAGVFESARGLGDAAKVSFARDSGGRSQQWRPLTDFDEYIPRRYQNATPEQKQSGHNGGDFFIVQDFIDAMKGNRKPAIDVYDACEWSAVAVLSGISCQNNGRAMKMPDFKNGRTFEL